MLLFISTTEYTERKELYELCGEDKKKFEEIKNINI